MLNILRKRVFITRVSNARHRLSSTSGTNVNYEKADETTSEPTTSHSGSQTYVVSEPDPQDRPYKVPSGAYATTSPYEPQTGTNPPESLNSSTSASRAHPTTTQHAPKNASGIGSSSAVRFRSAPGEMKDGSDGGLGLMNKGETQNLEQEGMASRNPQPKGEEEGKLGIDEAWKHRK